MGDTRYELQFAVRNPGRIHTWWWTISRSVSRSAAGRDWQTLPSKSETGEIGGEQIGQLGAIGPRRGAWRPVGRFLSFPTLSCRSLQSCETPALRRDTHHDRHRFVTSPFALTVHHARASSACPKGKREKKKDDHFERNAETRILRTLLCIYLNRPVSITSRVPPGNDLCDEVKRLKMVCSARGDLCGCPTRIRWKMCDRSRRKFQESVCVCVCVYTEVPANSSDLSIVTSKLLQIQVVESDQRGRWTTLNGK